MHVLFDLDGTLTNPREGFVNCIRFALTKLGVKIAADTNLESYIGPPLHSLSTQCAADTSGKLKRNE